MMEHFEHRRIIINQLIICGGIIFFISSCSQVPERKDITAVNPTSYVFDSSDSQLSFVIVSEFDHLRYRDMMLSYQGSRYKPLDTLEIFEQPGNERDFYLGTVSGTIGKSFVYPKYDYDASFHLHLNSIDPTHTELIVYTLNPRITVGTEFWPSPPHFVRKTKYFDVPPSSVEEYEILLRVGNRLKQVMPAIKYPL